MNGFEILLEDDLTLGLWIEHCIVNKVTEAEFGDFLASHIVALPDSL